MLFFYMEFIFDIHSFKPDKCSLLNQMNKNIMVLNNINCMKLTF